MTHTTDSFAAAVTADLARESSFFAAVADKHGTAFPVAGPDPDDLRDMGVYVCPECSGTFDEDGINLGCTDVKWFCHECHGACCTDRTCREGDGS